MLLRLMDALESEFEFDVVLLRGGPLTGRFEARARRTCLLQHPRAEGSGALATWYRRLIDRPLAQRRKLQRFLQLSATEYAAVHNNTATNGRFLDLLSAKQNLVVSHIHETAASIERFTRKRDWKRTIEFSGVFVAPSRAVEDDLTGRYNIDRELVRRIPNFLSVLPAVLRPSEKAAVRMENGLDPQIPLVTACGTNDLIKGPDLFADLAVHYSRSKASPAQFVWLGGKAGGDEPDHVLWLRNPPSIDLLLAASDCVVIPSRSESFSLVALQAAGAGVPVTAFAGSRGPQEVIGNFDELIAPDYSIAELSQRVEKILSNPSHHDKWSDILRQRVSQSFLAPAVAPRFADLWRGRAAVR